MCAAQKFRVSLTRIKSNEPRRHPTMSTGALFSWRGWVSGRFEVFQHQLQAGDTVVLVWCKAESCPDLRRCPVGKIEADPVEAHVVLRQLQLQVLVLEEALIIDAEYVDEQRRGKSLTPYVPLDQARRFQTHVAGFERSVRFEGAGKVRRGDQGLDGFLENRLEAGVVGFADREAGRH